VNLGENYVLQGKFPEGIREIRKGIELDTDSEYKATLVWAYMKSGDTKSAHAALNDLLKLAKSQYVYSYALANAYGFVGDKDDCLLWMEQKFRFNPHLLYCLGSSSTFPYRSNPRTV